MMSDKERKAWEEWEKEQDDLEDNDVGVPSQLIALIVIIFGVVVCSAAIAIGGKFGLGLFLGGAAVLFLAGMDFVDKL